MISKEKAIKKLESLIAQIDDLKGLDRGNAQFKKWNRDTQVAIEHIFGNESRHIADFNKIKYSLGAFSLSTPEYKFQQSYISGLENAEVILESMIEEIKEYWEEEIENPFGNDEKEIIDQEEGQNPNLIFLIHGHNLGIKDTLARFITQLGLHPIVLHEQANQGRTIIEKFEDYSDVGFAIALLTQDDIGSSIMEPENVMHRARQNVIFEFGYFIGKLGRDRVVGLIQNDIELPSDYSGVLYIPMDEDGAWHSLLIRELKSVGFDIDANKVF